MTTLTHYRCRIGSTQMKTMIFDILGPFLLGCFVAYLVWIRGFPQPSDLKPIVPFSVHLEVTEESSAWLKKSAAMASAPGPGPGASFRHRIWVITPTFHRPTQLAELTRVAQALHPVASFVTWLIFDDHLVSPGGDHLDKIKTLLNTYEGLYHQIRETPPFNKVDIEERQERAKRGFKVTGKGAKARRSAIDLIRKQKLAGFVYFADDDNTYDWEIFLQMHETDSTVSIWPVGGMWANTVSSPVVKKGKVIGYFDGFTVNRKFPVDFAGFAVHSSIFEENPLANVKYASGYMETYLLTDLQITSEQIKPLASNCTKVMAWHTKTSIKDGYKDNLMILVEKMYGRQRALESELNNTSVANLDKYYYYNYINI